MRCVVTGGRDYTDRAHLFLILDEAVKRLDMTELAHGNCPNGADNFADQWAIKHGFPCERFDADWSIGKRAGPMRNRRMLAQFKPDYVLRFPGGRGTADCHRQAEEMGIKVYCC